MTRMEIGVEDDSVIQADWIDEYRYETTAPCLVHHHHVPEPHLNHIHHVWPLGEGGPSIAANRIVVCPTGHYNIHKLLSTYLAMRGNVPYSEARTYAFGERTYAKLGYDRVLRKAM